MPIIMQDALIYHMRAKHKCLLQLCGSEAIDLAFRCLVSEGDEVLFPNRLFVLKCHEPLTHMAGGKAVIINTKAEDQFRPA